MKFAFETILISNGIAQNLEYHEKRFNKTRQEVFGCAKFKHIELGQNLINGRCKVVYSSEIVKIEFAQYIKQPIQKLQFTNTSIDYSYKWLDRAELNALTDDVLIVKNGLITDTKIANIAFFDGTNWLTPKEPLLEGTTRARLIDSGFLTLANLAPKDILPDWKIAIMNALRGFEEIGIVKEIIK